MSLLAYSMTCSHFCSSCCERMAPRPSAEASVAKMNGFSKSGQMRTGAIMRASLRSSNACCCLASQRKAFSFLIASQIGTARLANLGINLQ